MLTIFALPKSFSGHTGLIQRNAFASWRALGDQVEVLIFGSDDGVAETAAEFGFNHFADVKQNESGTPLVDDLFRKAEDAAGNDLICYVNSDMILEHGLIEAAGIAKKSLNKFLMVGQRWDLEVNEAIDFSDPDIISKLRGRVVREGNLHPHSGIDYFLFTRGLYREIPPFAIGRIAWDNWLVASIPNFGGVVVDATELAFAVHQNHDYNHVKGGEKAAWYGPEAQRNRELAGNMTNGVEGFIHHVAAYRIHKRDIIKSRQFRSPVSSSLDWDQMFKQLVALVEQGKAKDVLELLDRIKTQANSLPQYHYLRSIALFHLDRMSEALDACKSEIRFNPDAGYAVELMKHLETKTAGMSNRNKKKESDNSNNKTKSESSRINYSQLGSINEKNQLSNSPIPAVSSFSDKLEEKRNNYSNIIKEVDESGSPKRSAISVVIAVSGSGKNINGLIKKLFDKIQIDVEFIVVENGAAIEKSTLFDSLNLTRITLNSPVSLYAAWNIGALHSKSSYLLFVNEDVEPLPKLVEMHLNTYQKYEAIAVRGFVAPLTENKFNYQVEKSFLGEQPFPAFLAGSESHLSVKSEAFRHVGGFTDNFPLYGGAQELSVKLLDYDGELCKQVYQPMAGVFQDFALDRESLVNKLNLLSIAETTLVHDLDYYLMRISYNRLNGKTDELIFLGNNPLPTPGGRGELCSVEDSPRLPMQQALLDLEDYRGMRVLDLQIETPGFEEWMNVAESVEIVIPQGSDSNKVNLPGNINVRQCDLDKLPFENESFDIVIVRELNGLAKDLKQVIDELGRVSKGNGLLILAAKIQQDEAIFNLHILNKFESHFLAELEEHLEWLPNMRTQSFEHNVSRRNWQNSRIRPAILIARMRKCSRNDHSILTVPPTKVDGLCFSLEQDYTPFKKVSVNALESDFQKLLSSSNLESDKNVLKMLQSSLISQYEILTA
ncbi:MAG: methyltransferase domain-containing protein [Candidatus Electryonea clarkiae]|nr:methyltransferase domain-containing protein [Candidatus Electryonea clarkiae]MDP8287533.1 methyltransferase domain-containing protein [Candidatus Electryonea clarkiae]